MASPTVFASILTPGPGYFATSSSTIAVTTGTKTFITQSGLAYSAGARLRASSRALTTNFLEGDVVSYTSTNLVTVISTFGGSGTWTDWNLNIAGIQGATGATGSTGATGAAGTNGTNGTNGAPGVAYTPSGTWTSVTTYTQGQEVSYTTLAYIGLAAANVNHQPDVSPTWWQPLAGVNSQWVSGSSSAIYYNSGNVGIGTATPGQLLHVHGTGTGGARVEVSCGTSASPGYIVLQSGHTPWTIYQPAGSDNLNFFNGTGGDTLVLQPGGHIGIGTGTPGYALDVVGTVRATAFIGSGGGAPTQFSSYASTITGSIDGETTTFTLGSSPANVIVVYIDGVRYVGGLHYTWTPGTATITFLAGAIPQVGQVISVEGW